MTTMTPIPDPSHPVTGPRRRRRHLAVLLVLAGLVAAAPGVATLAGFTAQDVNRDNTISAGVLDVAFGQATSAFNVANMKPGDWFDTSVPILNTGSMTEDYSFSATSLRPGGPANLDEVLRVTVSRQGTVLAENLRFSTLRDVTGRLDAGGRDVLDLHVTWPENVPQVDNRYQGASLAMDLQVDAITTDLATPTTTPASTAPLGINGVAGATGIDVPFDPARTAITVVDATSTRFTVTNASATPQSFRFDSTATAEVWDGSGEWIISIVNPQWGWDGHQIHLAPGETRSFIANAWEPGARLSLAPIPPA